MNGPRRPSRRLNFDDAVAIQKRLFDQEFQHRIAADYDVNPARIAEIKNGTRFSGSREVALNNKTP